MGKRKNVLTFILSLVCIIFIVTFITLGLRADWYKTDPEKSNPSDELLGDSIPEPFTAIPTLSPTHSPTSPDFLLDQVGEDIDMEFDNDFSGGSISLSSNGKIVAIGARGNDGNGSYSSFVRVFEWNGITSTWNKMGTDIDAEEPGVEASQSVSLSSDGKTVAVGALYNSGNGTLYRSGHVRIFKYDDKISAWTQMGIDLDGETPDDWSGWSVSLSFDGKIVAVGAIKNDGNGNDSGHVRVFKYDDKTSTWMQMGPDVDGEVADNHSGRSVSLSSDGKTLAIGAPYNDGNGQVRVFKYDIETSAWTQIGADIDEQTYNDQYGFTVSLSFDGETVAIGTPFNDGGPIKGHLRIFKYHHQTSTWIQMGEDIDGEISDEIFGYSVSLSSDGKKVAFGAQYNDANGSNSGSARIYTWGEKESAWIQAGVDIRGVLHDHFGRSIALSSNGKKVAVGGSQDRVRVFKLPKK